MIRVVLAEDHYLVREGMPRDRIVLDYAGFDTWDSAQRAKRVFGVDSVVVVTSTYHVRRTRMIVRRCYHGDLAVVGARPPLGNRIVGTAWAG